MKDRILINKKLIPYKFNILLASDMYELEIHYNSNADLFTVRLYKDEQMVCAGEPIMYGMPLFADFYKVGKIPCLTIIPLDESGGNDLVTWDNMSETVFLCIDDEGDS